MNAANLAEQAFEGLALDPVSLHDETHHRIIEQLGERELFDRHSL